MKLDPPMPLDTGKLEKRGTSVSAITILLVVVVIATVGAWVLLWAGGVKRASDTEAGVKPPAVQQAPK